MPVTYEGENYNAIMRVVFIYLELLHNEPLFVPLESYWKIPPHPSGSGNMRDSLVSSFKLNTLPRVAQVDEADKTLVLSTLQKILPKLLRCVSNMSHDLSQFFEGTNNTHIFNKDADRMQMLRANVCAASGLFGQAMYYIYDYINKNPDDVQGKYEAAMTHLYCEDYDEAIHMFTEAPVMLREMRIAMCYRKKGNLEEAKEWIDKIPISETEPKVIAERNRIYSLLYSKNFLF